MFKTAVGTGDSRMYNGIRSFSSESGADNTDSLDGYPTRQARLNWRLSLNLTIVTRDGKKMKRFVGNGQPGQGAQSEVGGGN